MTDESLRLYPVDPQFPFSAREGESMRKALLRSAVGSLRQRSAVLLLGMAAADTDLTRRFRAEHRAIRADTDQLRVSAQTLGEPGAMHRVRRVHKLLTREVWPREHAEIAVQVARLGRLIDDIGDRAPNKADIADLRDILYSLYGILRLHTVQEARPTCHSATPPAPATSPPEPLSRRVSLFVLCPC
jgi:hypothetical protein